MSLRWLYRPALLVAVLALAAAPAAAMDTTDPVDPEPEPRVVVAVIDSSTNPYHEFFQTEVSSVTQEVLDEFDIGEDQIIDLTRTGDFAADFAADEAQFDAIEQGMPYWFRGTNVIGISFKNSGVPIMPDSGGDTHGVGTTAAVVHGNPEAVVVLVEGINEDSEEWAFTHPAVDAVTTSYGPIAGEPTLDHLAFSYTGVVTNGKHHFGAAANAPTPAQFDETGGPWWTIGVAGFEEGTSEGRTTVSGSFTDFVGDFTQDLPYCHDCQTGTELVGGTSFASPLSAGTFSAVLLEARRAADHIGGIVTEDVGQPLMVSGNDVALTNWDLRRALEEGAYYPATADYDPVEAVFDLGATPVVDAAPWAQTGWGAITPDVAHEVVAQTLAHLGLGGDVTRTKSAEACAFNTANIEARHLYWDNVALFGESVGTTADPYVYC